MIKMKVSFMYMYKSFSYTGGSLMFELFASMLLSYASSGSSSLFVKDGLLHRPEECAPKIEPAIDNRCCGFLKHKKKMQCKCFLVFSIELMTYQKPWRHIIFLQKGESC